MKTKQILFMLIFCVAFINLNAQIDVEGKAKDQTKNRANNKVDQGIDQGLDAVENGVKNLFKKKKPTEKKAETQVEETANEEQKSETQDVNPGSGTPSLQTYSKFDFIPGEKVIFYDDFTEGNIGDFPVKWNTNGSGEVVTNNLYEGRWFNITNGDGATVLDQPITLPENYTIEFDVVPQKNQDNGNNVAWSFNVLSTSKPKDIDYGLARPGDAAIRFDFAYTTYYHSYYRDGTPELSGNTDKIRLLADKKYKISIWVQKERIRLYVDETKVFDLPKAISKNYKYNMLRFDRGTTMFANFRIATGLPDTRSKLITEGKLVSYGIYFDVNKDVVKPESYATLKSISDVLKENSDVRVKITGHTDADGDDAKNMDLSKRRGASVKNELAKNFGIDASRLESDGMGESQPVAPNDTPVNKALNRRVEFVKL